MEDSDALADDLRAFLRPLRVLRFAAAARRAVRDGRRF
jgi:hypothetical protein